MREKTRQVNKGRCKKTTETNEYFNRIHNGAREAIKAFSSGQKLTFDKVVLPEPPKEMKAIEIIELRKKLNVSQRVFAHFLNVSTKTVQAWEHKQNHPGGASLRLLQIVKNDPNTLTKL